MPRDYRPWTPDEVDAALALVELHGTGGMRRYAAKSGRSEALLETTIESANNNAEISRLKDRKIEKIQVILVRHEGAKAKIDEKYAADRRRIENALPEDDGPLAPVLRDWLWSLPADQSDSADPIRPRPRASDARYVGPAGQ
jgi:hypothetical protein